uniref:Large ribosomal subunit protein uL11 C-terminal domain-containing protein n=1 Tax=Solanum lycopersicum TaxID=4081 RepID=A0A3Q7GVZ0_SOLLC
MSSIKAKMTSLTDGALKGTEQDKKKAKNINHNGKISLDVVIEIAKVIQPRSMAKDLSITEILGTYVSVCCTVDGKDTKDLQQDIIDGVVDIPND